MFESLPSYREPKQIKPPSTKTSKMFISRTIIKVERLANKRLSAFLRCFPEILENVRRLTKWCFVRPR
jgi:hypothetical protein